MTEPNQDYRAIDAVVNIWTPEALSHRPGWQGDFFVGKMKAESPLMAGLSLKQMIERLDAAGIERAFLIAPRTGQVGLPGCYHLPYEVVARACEEHPDRFSGLAGIDPTQGMQGVRMFEDAVRNMGFVGAHLYPHWFELAPDHARYYPLLREMLRTRRADTDAGRAIDDLRQGRAAPQRGTAHRARRRRLRLPGAEADRDPRGHSLARGNDRHVVEARQRVHRQRRPPAEILAGQLPPLHQFIRAGQGDLRHRLPRAGLRAHRQGHRRARPAARRRAAS